MVLERFLAVTKEFLTLFCTEISLHGLKHLIQFKRHPTEIALWVIIICIAGFGTMRLSMEQWRRYIQNPTVLALEKDHRNWNATLPAVSACFNVRVDEEKAKQLIQSVWGVDESQQVQFDYYMSYIQTLANISYNKLVNLDKFISDESLNKVSMTTIVETVHPVYLPTRTTFDIDMKMTWGTVMSELGMCYTFNSAFSYLQGFRTNITKGHSEKTKPILCSFINHPCYARIDTPIGDLTYYIHSPYDLLSGDSVATKVLPINNELTILLKVTETTASQDLRKLSPSQRRCYFSDEPISKSIPIYSANICHLHCKVRLALEKCGCRPFFYNFVSDKVCDIKGLICVSKINFVQLITYETCKCFRPCTELTYSIQTQRLIVWLIQEGVPFGHRASFRWELLQPKLRLRRNILFSFEDLIVSFGGAAALFLGWSFLSAIEGVYIVIRFIVVKVKQRKETQFIN